MKKIHRRSKEALLRASAVACSFAGVLQNSCGSRRPRRPKRSLTSTCVPLLKAADVAVSNLFMAELSQAESFQGYAAGPETKLTSNARTAVALPN